MSARALRRLREQRAAEIADTIVEDEDDDEDDDDDDDDEDDYVPPKKSTFLMMNDSDDEDESSSSSSSSSSDEVEEAPKEKLEEAAKKVVEEEPEENLDDLLEEFKEQDEKLEQEDEDDGGQQPKSPFQFLVNGMDVRDMDMDYVMRAALMGTSNDSEATTSKRRSRQAFLFGQPRDLNTPRPPHYVGGGIGMTSYDRDARPIPWPYDSSNQQLWFTFIQADSYERDAEDFQQIRDSGDFNAMVLFLAHHPYVTPGLLQLAMVLYHSNQSQEGQAFLKRCIWIYECSALTSFTNRLGNALMDFDQPENKTFFLSLFRLTQVSNIAGLYRASFAVARFLLSLDPLRDPVGILVSIDSFALKTNLEAHDQWVVDIVESQKIQISHKDDDKVYKCGLLDLPNWSYSYALALFRLAQTKPDKYSESLANAALKEALLAFPSIVNMLLGMNEVDVHSRSCARDWPTVLEYLNKHAEVIGESVYDNNDDLLLRRTAMGASELISKIFVQLNHTVWNDNDVVTWMYTNVEELQNATEQQQTIQPYSLAMTRYARIDPADYETKFQLLPPEANPLDMALVNQAMVVDPNRRRFLQRVEPQAPAMFGGAFGLHPAVRPTFFGPPRHVVDLDWPLVEVFWRSLLPWNRVEGIPRPPPPPPR